MRGLTLRIALVLGVSAVAGFAGCFTAPSADVQFSCDLDDAPACPPGYSCEADGCCHRDGTDVQATFGDCKLEGGTGGSPGTAPGTETDPSGSGSTGVDTDSPPTSIRGIERRRLRQFEQQQHLRTVSAPAPTRPPRRLLAARAVR